MIRPMVTELQFIGLEAEGQAENLMAQTNAENRIASDQLLHGLRGIGKASGSPGPFERKMPSGLSASTSAADVEAGTTVT